MTLPCPINKRLSHLVFGSGFLFICFYFQSHFFIFSAPRKKKGADFIMLYMLYDDVLFLV